MITYSIFFDKRFSEAFTQLVELPMKPALSQKFSKMAETISSAEQSFGEEYGAIVKECVKLDDTGNPVTTDNGGVVIAEDKTEYYKNSIAELKQKPIQGVVPVYISDLGDDIKISPKDLGILREVLV